MCIAIKRSMNPGFAGIENELYFADHTYMLFGDAKAVVGRAGEAALRRRNPRRVVGVSTTIRVGLREGSGLSRDDGSS